MIRTATVYRTNARALKLEVDKHNYLDGTEPQFEFAVFSDGKVAQRWLLGDSLVWWNTLEDLYSVHIYPHQDYGTRVDWNDGSVEEL